MSDWLKVMLEELERKKQEAKLPDVTAKIPAAPKPPAAANSPTRKPAK